MSNICISKRSDNVIFVFQVAQNNIFFRSGNVQLMKSAGMFLFWPLCVIGIDHGYDAMAMATVQSHGPCSQPPHFALYAVGTLRRCSWGAVRVVRALQGAGGARARDIEQCGS